MLGLGVPELFIVLIVFGGLYLMIFKPLKKDFDESYSGEAPSKEVNKYNIAAQEKSVSKVTSSQAAAPPPTRSKPSMEYGAKQKGFLWKLGCYIGINGIALFLITIFGMESRFFGIAFAALIFYFGLGFLFTIPYGIKPIPQPIKSKGSSPRFIFYFTHNILLLIFIGWMVLGVYYGLKLIVALGDLIYTSLWKVIRPGGIKASIKNSCSF